jgi:phenylalanyl-tRNA synthetase beta chain
MMVVVEYLYEDMERLTGLSKRKIIEGLTELGAPTEEEQEHEKLITELTPNRPDWFSMEGLARTLKCYYSGKMTAYTSAKSDYKVSVDSSVRKIRPYTVCAVVKELVFSEQRIRDMILLQEKLLATLGRRVKKFGIGVYPLEAVAFPIKYITMRSEEIQYTPLNYPHEASASEILEKHPKGQEYGYLIKNAERYPVFVDAKGKIMCLIPIVNSAETGQVMTTTKAIFIEVTGMDMNAILAALNILTCTFVDMGGKVYSVEINYPGKKIITPDLSPKKMRIEINNVNKLLGVKLDEKFIHKALVRMGYAYKNGVVFVPPYRADVMHEVDVIEDIAIVYGYNKFEPTMPNFFSCGKKRRRHPANSILQGMGFLETSTFILTNKDNVIGIGGNEVTEKINNPAGEEFNAVRVNLVADMLNILSLNKMKGLPQKFYEIGRVYDKKDREKLIFAVCDKQIVFADFRGYVQTLMHETKKRFEVRKKEMLIFDEECSTEIIINESVVGILGKVSKQLLEKFGIESDVYLCEIEI